MVEAHPAGDGARAGPVLRPMLAAAFAVGAAGVMRSGAARGAVLVTLTPDNGLHTGDLLALPFLLVAVALVGPWSWSPVPPLQPTQVHPHCEPTHRPGAGPPPERKERLVGVPLGAVLLVLAALDLADFSWWRRDVVALTVAVALIAAAAAAGLALLGACGRRALSRPPPPLGLLAAGAVLVVGYLLDTALSPSGTVVGPMALAAWGGWARRPAAAAHWYALAAVLALANVAALADVAGLDVAMANHGGGPARTIALGAVLVLGATGDHTTARRSWSPAGAARR